jgi:hypothetical protein
MACAFQVRCIPVRARSTGAVLPCSSHPTLLGLLACHVQVVSPTTLPGGVERAETIPTGERGCPTNAVHVLEAENAS